MSPESQPFFVPLPGRGLIHLEGEDRHKLLQNLITNDINRLKPGTQIYSAMLNTKGKFLYDFFIREGDDFTLLDCEGGDRANSLYKKLKMYKLRMDVKISVEDQHPVYGVFHDSDEPVHGLPDPRHPTMGERTFEQPQDMDEKPFEVWDKHRISLGIPDGSRDMAEGKDTALDCNLDKINGVSFEKGCYVGQEITSRMHLRNIRKKSLYTLKWKTAVPEPFTDIHDDDGTLIGEMRSHCDNIGLAMLKISEAEAGNFSDFEILDHAGAKTRASA